MKHIYINVAYEDSLSLAILKAIVNYANPFLSIYASYGGKGSSYLRKKIKGFNNASKYKPFIVLTDLDNTECAPILLKNWLPNGKDNNLIFRIAVHEVESWVMADRESFSKFMGIPKIKIPLNSDSIHNPKEFVISLARKSRKKIIRDSLVPKANSTARIGPDYNGALIEFIENHWIIKSAQNTSISLKSAIHAIQQFGLN